MAFPPPARNAFLAQKYPLPILKTILKPREQWKPFPTAAERAAWETLPESVRKAQLAQGERCLNLPWPHLEASNYLKYSRVGNRSEYEKPYFERRDILAALVIAECIEGQGRFLDAITNAAWSICEESSWVVPAHINAQGSEGLADTANPVVDLFAAETGALLAWTLYLLGEPLQAVSPLVGPRIEREVDQRILTPCLTRDDFWWMGFTPRKVNNWNPWVNSNWLACVLLVERDEDRRLAAVAKILRSLDRFVVPYPRDGGCDEGPSYWGRAGASLFDNLELLYSATGGQLNQYGDPLVQDIGRFIYRAHIANTFYLNFADASAVLTPDAMLVYNYGRRIEDQAMISFGAWLAEQADVLQGKNTGRDLGRLLPALFSLDSLPQTPAQAPLVRDVYLDTIQVMVARDQAGSAGGFYLAAKGGHNAESHNHNDVGNFVTYVDGNPVLVDVGVETYTRKTFSQQRYEIWTMQSAYHSLPTINGILQAPGETFAARSVTYEYQEEAARFSLDLAGAYPAEAGIKTWLRTLTLHRGRQVVLEDAYQLVETPSSLTLSLMTPCKVDLSQPGMVGLDPAPLTGDMQAGAARLSYDPAVFEVSAEEIPIADPRLASAWGSRMTRLLFTVKNPQTQGAWKITITRV